MFVEVSEVLDHRDIRLRQRGLVGDSQDAVDSNLVLPWPPEPLQKTALQLAVLRALHGFLREQAVEQLEPVVLREDPSLEHLHRLFRSERMNRAVTKHEGHGCDRS